MGNPVFKFTLTHANLGTRVISEPDGWKDAKIKVERHPDYHSLVEYFEGGFIFYGENNIDDGGADFIRQCENLYGVNTEIVVVIQADINGDGTYEETIFTGLLDLSGLQEVQDNKIEVPIVRNSLWSKFISRLDTPIDLRSTVDLDGNAISPVEPVDINLPSQKIRQKYQSHLSDAGLSFAQFTNGSYYQFDFNDVLVLNEIKEKYSIPYGINTEVPVNIFEIEYGGSYHFDIRIVASAIITLNDTSVKTPTDLIDFYIQFDLETPIPFSWVDQDLGGGAARTVFTYNASHALRAKADIRIYGRANANSSNDLVIGGGTSIGLPGEFQTYCNITADTTYPSTEAKGFYLHDVFAGIVERICGTNSFYSEILGRTDTNMRQYVANGCYSPFIILKGLHIRGFTLEEKIFSISFNKAWKIADPIFNLGLGYEQVNGSEMIRLENKARFYNPTSTSVLIENIRTISREYDPEKMYNLLEFGYEKSVEEVGSGYDDIQGKRSYATIL